MITAPRELRADDVQPRAERTVPAAAVALDEPASVSAAARRRLSPAVWLAVIVLGSGVVRVLAALRVRTPFFLPDEYLYSSMARSFAHTGMPEVRGTFLNFPWLLGPILMSPAWLVHDVGIAYRLAQGLGVAWFSLSAIPAYLLARRLDVSTDGAIAVAALSVLVPGGAFTMGLLTEPIAYTLFLAGVLLAVDACSSRSGTRRAAAVALMLALCLVRAQFLPVWGVYLAAAAVGAGSYRTFVRRQWPVLAGLALAVVAVAGLGTGRFSGVYSGMSGFRYPLASIAGSFGLNLFVLAIASGWVIVPGAAVSLGRMVRDREAKARVFATLTLGLTAASLLEAACFAPNSAGHVLERYTFYVAPLLAIAFVREGEARPGQLAIALLSYCGIVVALLLGPVLDNAPVSESPTLLGFLQIPGATAHTPVLIWGPVLAVASVAAGLLRRRPRVVLTLAAAIAAALSLAGSKAFIDEAAARADTGMRITAPWGSALLTYSGAEPAFQLETLFWAPQISRVLVLGGGASADGFAFRPVTLANLAAEAPVVVGNTAVSAVDGPRHAFLFGRYRSDGQLDYVGRIIAGGGTRPAVVSMRLRSTAGTRRLSLRCTIAPRRIDVLVGPTPRMLRLRIPAGETQSCRFGLSRGTPVRSGVRLVSRIRLDRFAVRAS